MEAGEAYSSSAVQLDDGYVIFFVEDHYSMIERCSDNTYLTDSSEIRKVLKAYSESLTQGPIKPNETTIERMEVGVKIFTGSRTKEEECKRYTGIDRFPCHDRESCIVSCYTPMCSDLKHGTGCEVNGQGCEFIDAIAEFSNSLAYMDNCTDELMQAIRGFPEADGVEPFEQGIVSIDRLISTTELVNSNSLLRTIDEGGYYFCPKVDYDTSVLIALREELVGLRNAYSLGSELEKTVSFIESETTRRIELRKKIERCSQDLRYCENAIKGISGSGHPTVNYTEVQGSVSKMNALYEELIDQCNSRGFTEAAGSVNAFREEEQRANTLLANLSAEYDSVRLLHSQVLDELSLVPADRNTSGIFESMRMVDQELDMIKNRSDLMLLKNVIVENRETIKKESAAGPGILSLLLFPAIAALFITAGLYFVIKRNRRGL